jgi:urease accessory protein
LIIPFPLHLVFFILLLLHPLTGTDHVVAMGAVGLWGALVGGRAIWAWPTTFLAVMVVGFVAARLGLQISFVEYVISASIVVLGLLAAVRVRAPLALGVAIVGLFAFFHGHAHGTEATGASALSYAVGFTLSTAVLLGAGIGLGLCIQGLIERRALSPVRRMRGVAGGEEVQR